MKKIIFVFLLSIISVSSALQAELLKVEELFREPQFSSPEISPDGKTLALLAPNNGVMNIALIDVATKQTNFLTKEKEDVGALEWVNSERLIYWTGGDVKDDKGRYAGGMFAVNKNGKKFKVLRKPYGSVGGRAGRMQSGRDNWFSYRSRYKDDDKYVLVTDRSRRSDYPDLSLLNVYTGRLKVFYKNPGFFTGLFIDDDGNVRGATEVTDFEDPEGTSWICIFDDEAGEWKKVWKTTFTSGRIDLEAYDPDSDKLFVLSDEGRNTMALFEFDWKKGKYVDKPIYEDDRYDILSILRSPKTDRMVGVVYQADKPKLVYFDENFKTLQSAIDSALPNYFNRIISTDDEMKVAVIRSYSDVQYPRFYLLYLESMKMEFLSDSKPWLKATDLCHTRPITFAARDGLRIDGYLTLPKTWSEGNPVPLFLYPHGGPWARDVWGQLHYITAEVQYWASRGYAVLQVNFRGSTGYGTEHLEKSFKHIREMHYDLIDSVKWAIDEGYADPDRVGVGGASWGGYSTMVCLTQNPEMFKFGINFMGVVDIPMQINRYKSPAWDFEMGYNFWVKRIGDPADPEDRKVLEEFSAINHIDKINHPLFIYHGIRDRNVHIEQARALTSALDKAKKPYTAIIRTKEQHSVSDEDDRFDTYNKIDAFLREHGLLYNQ